MSFFKQIEGEAAILVSNGVYLQVDLYSRAGYLYAKYGTGFVRLMRDGSTTKAKLRLDTMTWTGSLCADSLGRLCEPGCVEDAKVIDGEPRRLLLTGRTS